MRKGTISGTIEELCDVRYGTRVTKKVDGGTKYPVYGGGGETFRVDLSNRSDCLVVSRFGMSPDCTRFVAGEFFLNDSGLTVHTKDADLLWQPYLDRYLLWLNDTIYALGRGSAQKNLNVDAFRAIHLAVPPFAEQKRIVAILDEAFAAIATAATNAERNLQSARALFESHLQSVFTQRGPGWVEKKLGEISEFKNGLNYNKSSGGQTLPVVGVADFQEHYLVPLSELQSATIDGDLADNYAIRPNDILTVRSNGSKHLVGRCMLVGDVDEVVSYSGFIIRIRFDAKTILPQFLLHFMKCQATRSILTAGGGGANINNINQDKLSTLLVPLPPLKTQIKLAAELDEMREQAQRLARLYEQKLAALESLKEALLHKAFIGELTTDPVSIDRSLSQVSV